MWFKQAHVLQLVPAISGDEKALAAKLEPLAFRPCLPSLPSSHGWVAPLDQEDAPLVYATSRYLLICMQLEEKILPASVVRQALDEKIKQIRSTRGEAISQKEKYALRDEIIHTLLPRAFSKLSRFFAFFDKKNNWLIINTTIPSKLENFLGLFKKTLGDTAYHAIESKGVASTLTQWLLEDNAPRSILVEKFCLLKDPNQQRRVIRCQQQDLSVAAIRSLIKDGCEVDELSLNWHDKITFTLTSTFDLKSICYHDEVKNLAKDGGLESKQQQFEVDFFIMTEILSTLIQTLIDLFSKDIQAKRVGTTEEKRGGICLNF